MVTKLAELAIVATLLTLGQRLTGYENKPLGYFLFVLAAAALGHWVWNFYRGDKDSEPSRGRKIATVALATILIGCVGYPWVVGAGASKDAGSAKTLDGSALELAAIRDVDTFFAGKDEASLREFFGVREMFEVNMKYETERLQHFMTTGNKEFPFGPYMGDGTATIDLGLPGTRAYPFGGTIKLDTDPRMVHLAIIPRSYSEGRTRIYKYETLIGLPDGLVSPLKDLVAALDANVNTLIAVLNDQLQSNRNYYLMREDGLPEFRYAIDHAYYQRFKSLNPIADKIRESARASLGLK
ncbi:MAG TPA: hypothetical protein VGN17_26120 [Bryobacteraceae bacterium]|jgi:hypothetical protein